MKLREMDSITSSILYTTTIQRCEREYENSKSGRVKKIEYKINDEDNISAHRKYSNKLLYFVDFKCIYEELLSLVREIKEVDNISIVMFIVKKDDVVYKCVATVSLDESVSLTEEDEEFIEDTLKLYICDSLFPGDKTICKDVANNLIK